MCTDLNPIKQSSCPHLHPHARSCPQAIIHRQAESRCRSSGLPDPAEGSAESEQGRLSVLVNQPRGSPETHLIEEVDGSKSRGEGSCHKRLYLSPAADQPLPVFPSGVLTLLLLLSKATPGNNIRSSCGAPSSRTIFLASSHKTKAK